MWYREGIRYSVFVHRAGNGKFDDRMISYFFFFYCPSTFVLLGNDRSMMGELKILPHVYNIVIISRSAIDAAHAT